MKMEDFRNDGLREVDTALNQLSERVIGACIEVHRELGPGLLESMYEEALCHELDLREIRYRKQVAVSVIYKGKTIGLTRIDLLVEEQILLELKSCEAINNVHRAQLICYMRLLKKQLGLIVNFNVPILVDGVKRVVLTS